MSCGVGHRCGLDRALLWLWYRLAAIALIQPLAWEPLYTTDVALKRQKTYTHKKKRFIFLQVFHQPRLGYLVKMTVNTLNQWLVILQMS